MKIADNQAVFFHYVLTDDGGEVLDSSEGAEPLGYVHGAGGIVKGLERAMTGREVGDEFNVTLAPEDAYGASHDALIQVVPRRMFEGLDAAQLKPGFQFQTRTEHGPMAFMVTKVEGDDITVDGNHPLAGETLHFAVEIVDIREATEEEREHGLMHDDACCDDSECQSC